MEIVRLESIAHFVLSNEVEQNKLKLKVLKELIGKLNIRGKSTVVLVSSDGLSSNNKLSKEIKNWYLQTYGQELYFVIDPTHVLKGGTNTLMNYNLKKNGHEYFV